MLSILSALSEAIRLWARNILYLVPITVVPLIPSMLIKFYLHPHKGSLEHIFVYTLTTVLDTLADAAVAAAILGLLKAGTTGDRPWNTAWQNLRAYTGTLLGVRVLLILLTGILGLAVSAIYLPLSMFGSEGPWWIYSYVTIFVGILFLVVLKFALADLFVVLEQQTAWKALASSWEMTKGRFVYVFGCYFFLAIGMQAIQWLISKVDNDLLSLFLASIMLLLSSLWVILAWVMYFQIKAVDQPPDEPVPVV